MIIVAMGWLEVLTAGATGLLSGAVGSIFAPWSNWGVEKKREKRAHQRRLVQSWYAMINSCRRNDDVELIEHKDYVILRAYLGDKMILKLEHSSTHITISANAQGLSSNEELDMVLREIQRLERNWKLV